MVKFTVFFNAPDPAAEPQFEDAYQDFLALVERMPLVQRRQVNHVLGSPAGETSLYRVLEVYYNSYADLQESLRSRIGQEAGKELARRFRREAIDMIFAEVYEEAGGQTPAGAGATWNN
ncbi:EthD family reductase [Anaerolineae bacterium CFX9]|nr:EthD family reductase [Anaerolineae bacterium CFX9]